MVRVLLLLTSLLLALPAQAVSIKLQKSQVVFGEAVVVRVVTLSNENLQSYLQALPKQAWAKDFAIELHTNGRNRAAYYLYPYQTGNYQLAAGGIFKGAAVRVLPNALLQVDWQTDAGDKMYHTQAWPWTASVKLSDPSLRVYFKKYVGIVGQRNPDDLAVELIDESMLAGELKGDLQALYRFKAPNFDDKRVVQTKQLVHSPAVEVDFGQRHPWKFFARPIELQPLPLPSFLPPDVLIGALQFTPQSLPNWGQKGDLLYWRWQVSGMQMSETDFRRALQQLMASQPKNRVFEWFAPKVEWISASEAQISIPIRLQDIGKIHLPQWRWRYFDLASGKLIMQDAPPQSIWVLAAWHLQVIYAVEVILALGVLLLLVAAVRFYWRRYQLLHWVAQQDKATELAPKLWKLSARLTMQDPAYNWQVWQQQMAVTDRLRDKLQQAAYAEDYAEAGKPRWREDLLVALKRQHFSLAILTVYLKYAVKQVLILFKTVKKSSRNLS